MTRKILCVAPHPDDETLGCGGLLLREAAEDAEIHWLIVTRMTETAGFTAARMADRELEIEAASKAYPFTGVHRLGFPTAALETLPIGDLVSAISGVVGKVAPTDIYLPYPRDAHTDHRIVFEAGAACTKWFRYGSVRRVLAYEAQSETDFDINPDSPGFRPNVFVDISAHLERKLEIARLFGVELREHPFPRSETGIRALATVRGAACGTQAAEAFMLLKERL